MEIPLGDDLPAQKPASPNDKPQDQSMLSFIPAGMARSIAEYLVAAAAGAIPLFAFFALAQVTRAVFQTIDLIGLAFVPVICIMPIIAGAVGALVLEKLRSKPLTMQRGAMVGAAAGLAGSFVSIVMLAAASVLLGTSPFGFGIVGLVLYALLVAVVGIDLVLGALGGALVVKFVKEV